MTNNQIREKIRKDYIRFVRIMNAINYNMEEDENKLSDTETIGEFYIENFN